jgi:acyl-CoA dehydrogenase
MTDSENNVDRALAGATPYLRLFAETTGGCMLVDEALASIRHKDSSNGSDTARRIAIARFFAENLTVHAEALERAVMEGGDDVGGWDAALADTGR